MSFPQRCKCCSRPSEIIFQVDDKTWSLIVPEHFQKTVLCLNCFDSFASVKGISYVEKLEKEMCFCGQAGIISFKIKKITPAQFTTEDVI